MANLATRVPKANWPMIATLVRSIFEQPDRDATWSSSATSSTGSPRPGSATSPTIVLDAADDILAFSAFPVEHWPKIRSNNPQERLNKEIRRRTDVVGIFPNRAAVIRLVGALLAEQTDEWAIARRYMSAETLAKPAPPRHLAGRPETRDRSRRRLTDPRPAAAIRRRPTLVVASVRRARPHTNTLENKGEMMLHNRPPPCYE